MLSNLNPEQLEAVTDNENPLLVLAGAGSGKTTLLTVKYAYLVKNENIPPNKIFAVTFTNKAANEMKERISKLTGINYNLPWISTFHSFGARVLRRFIEKLGYKNDFVIYDDNEQKSFLKKLIKDELNLDEKTYPFQKISYFINSLKNKGISPEELEIDENNRINANLKVIYSFYQDSMRKNNSVDFGDLLYLTFKLFSEYPEVLDFYKNLFDFILVDEYQDTNHIQYSIIKLLAENKKKICVVGDDDQSIYGWRGATVENILRFEKDFPGAKVIKLEQNYRSTSNILDAANSLISKNRKRKGKVLWTDRGRGEKILLFKGYNEYEEARFVVNEIVKLGDYSNCAILYRTNAQSRVFEDELVKRNIPYVIVGGFKFFDRKEVKDIIAYLKVINNTDDILSFERIINTPPRGIGSRTFFKLIELSKELNENIWNSIEYIVNDKVDFPTRAKKGIISFYNDIKFFKDLMNRGECNISDLTALLIEKINYLSTFDSLDFIERENKILNIQELISSIKHFEDMNPDAGLTEYLDNVSLTSSVDIENKDNRVTLMTIHAAKGLEFDYVFFTGFESSLLPHMNSRTDDEIEEERRLCYVAITRAKKKLYLSFCENRSRGRISQFNLPSPFLKDIPEHLIEIFGEKKEKKMVTKVKVKHMQESSVKTGMLVNHRKFGIGKVISLMGMGEEQKIVIFFKKYGKKTLLLNKAPLQFL